ncbi:MAG: hypothetical protein RhofKO_04810 [Rhodothermales bacterium]
MALDLSTYHEPITDLFPRPAQPAEYESFRLTDEQVAHYQREGYVSGIRVLTDAQIDTLRAELDTLFDASHDGNDLWHEYHSNESGDPNNVLFHALGAWRIKPSFHDALWNPAITVPASQLLGGSVRFWHDQLFCKPAQHGGVVAWHQDYSYWTRTKPMRHLTCWIGLDDATKDNGCLHYIPRSHHWELLPVTGLANNMGRHPNRPHRRAENRVREQGSHRVAEGACQLPSPAPRTRVVREPHAAPPPCPRHQHVH